MIKALKNKYTKKDIWDIAKGYIFMVLGCISYGASTSLFLAPNGIVAGGVTGLSVILNIVLDNLITVGIISIIINVPILLMGLKFQGWKFILKCLVTIVCLGLITDLIEIINVAIQDASVPIVENEVICSVYGGILQGIGIGLFVRFQFSSGGTELLARVVARFIKGLNIPVVLGILDGIIVVGGAFVSGVENVFYALIVVFLSTKVSEVVLFGIDKSKLCIIISDKGDEIAKTLIEKSPRGVTKINGEGMYTHNDHQVLLTCVKNNQLTQVKQIVNSIDPKAFIIINESIEVRGQGFKALNESVDEVIKKGKKQKEQQEQIEQQAQLQAEAVNDDVKENE